MHNHNILFHIFMNTADVSIEFSEYTVMEGSGQATVCVVANGFGFAVSLHTMFSGIAGQKYIQCGYTHIVILSK